MERVRDRYHALRSTLGRWRLAIVARAVPVTGASRRLAARLRLARWWPLVGGVAVVAAIAAVVVVAAVVSGSIDSSNTTLMFMGFDADRAQLITALLIAAAAAAAANLATNRSAQATLAGLGCLAALFGPTFARETGNALSPSDVIGTFSPTGWLLSVLALVMVGLVSSWAGSALAGVLRPGLIEAGAAVRDAVRSRQLSRSLLGRPLGVAVVLILLIVSVPVFGDMVNYTPDAPMLHGGPPRMGLIPADQSNDPMSVLHSRPTGSSTPSPSAGASTRDAVAGATVQPSPSAGPTRSAPANWRPWQAQRPSGSGSFKQEWLPAPWTDSQMNINGIDVYLPPGYDPKGSRRYPVLYEAPYTYDLWDKSMNVGVVLDTLIDTGAIPPMLVVFVNTWQAPIDDTECANSVDGRQWIDTYLAHTIVDHMDANYLTIPRREARAFTGFSQGAYCAAIVPLRHPEVFGTGIPISGYYHVGGGGPNSLLPFAGDQAALDAASPVIAATRLTPAQRDMLFFIVVAQENQVFFGTEATDFEQVLKDGGYYYVAVNSDVGHGWEQVRHELPWALELWSAHLVDIGVF